MTGGKRLSTIGTMMKRSLFYRRRPDPAAIRKKRWNIGRIAGKALKRTCMVLGAIMLVWIVLSAIVVMTIGSGGKTRLPDEMVLVLKMDQGLVEKAGAPSVFDPFPYRQPTLHDVIARLDAAAKDHRVKGFVLSLKSGDVTLTQVQELRNAILRFRATGKFTKFYTASFADYGYGLSLYYLASAFDEVWMQPVGMLAMTGISLEMPYARAVLDKIGARPEFLQREEYKSAMENFTAHEMSPASRESYQSIVDDYIAQIVDTVARERKMSRSVLASYIDLGVMSGDEALKAKLIDRLDYADVMVDEIDQAVSGAPDSQADIYVPLDYYHSETVKKKRPSVAVVQVVGMIAPGTGRDVGGAASDDIAAALHEAAENDSIKAVLLRVDSPGGSPSASETIRRAVLKVQEEGKKVVVSMGTVAASGGYWVAAPADAIFASPSTLTGSIGVVMGKVSLGGLWDMLGVNWQSIRYGENADLFSMNDPLDAAGRARLNDLIDDTYDQFLDRVAQGRGMTKEEARVVAKGRAWTGAQAKERGLVDALGGQTDALDYIARELGYKDRTDLSVVMLPHPKGALEQLIEFMEMQVSMGQWFGAARARLMTWQGATSGVQAVEPLGLFQ